ncbi:MAG: hypothetical protein KAJ62_14115 [Desulfobacteraceae bacterium]|nr:hypothetical protein [Desulfobacteraceae bacterium]
MKSKHKKNHYDNKDIDKQALTDIRTVFKGVGALVFVIVMLFIVIKKIKNIKDIQTSSWLKLAVIFIFCTLAGVKMSGFLEKKTNLSENTCMNISVGVVFSIVGAIVYLFWDQFFLSFFS